MVKKLSCSSSTKSAGTKLPADFNSKEPSSKLNKCFPSYKTLTIQLYLFLPSNNILTTTTPKKVGNAFNVFSKKKNLTQKMKNNTIYGKKILDYNNQALPQNGVKLHG